MRWPAGATPLIGMGCMRLSTERGRDDAGAIDALHAAFDAGVTVLDTADAYCWDDTETGHNERLIARALATWHGDRSAIRVATKGGLTRPDGAWAPDARARHLTAACSASRHALGVGRIDLYQLHVPDPRTPLTTSVRALAALQHDGLIGSIGLCNVTVGQIDAARRLVSIDAVQVELSVWHDEHLLSGVVQYCIDHGITLLAYRPLGGAARHRRTATEPTLLEIAARHHATPAEIALAWLIDLSPQIVPLAGATRAETARSIARARGIVLSDEDREQLAARIPASRALRPPGGGTPTPPAARSDADVVLIMGMPGAGKSTLAQSFVDAGYQRLNRDEAGGGLRDLLPALDSALAARSPKIVLDNTYASRKSRAEVIRAARQHRCGVTCLWLATSVEDAQVNAVSRIVSRYGRLLTPDELRAHARTDVAAFAPSAQFRYQRELEPPTVDEGFARVETRSFVRSRVAAHTARAVMFWCDGVLRRSRSGRRTPESADDVEIIGDRGPTLRQYAGAGWRLLGISWQPEIADEAMTVAEVETALARTRDLLGVDIEFAYCPHGAGPPTCWCRKPLPGLGVAFVHRYRLDPAQCVYVGTGAQDPGFARRLGFQYRAAAEFFAPPSRPVGG